VIARILLAQVLAVADVGAPRPVEQGDAAGGMVRRIPTFARSMSSAAAMPVMSEICALKSSDARVARARSSN